MQRPRVRLRGACFQPAQGGGAGQRPVSSECRLHQHVFAQAIVIVQIFMNAAQPVDALRQHVAHRVHNPRGSLSAAAALCVKPMRSSICLSSIRPPSLDGSPPLKSASISRRPIFLNPILSPVHFGMVKPSSNLFTTLWKA